MSKEYEKEYFIGIVMLQSDLDVLKRALRTYDGNEQNVEKAYNLLELIKAQEKAQKNWDDDDPKTEALKSAGISINRAFAGVATFNGVKQ